MSEFDHYGDVPLTVKVELGRCAMTLDKLLKLEEGSVFTLSRSGEQPIDLYIGGIRAGVGEMVLLPASLGFRIKQLDVPGG